MELTNRPLTAGCFPGTRTINGTRVPESYNHRFARGSPTPWSLQKKMIVLSYTPSSLSWAISFPAQTSMAVISS